MLRYYDVDLPMMVEVNPGNTVKEIYKMFQSQFNQELQYMKEELKEEYGKIKLRPTNQQLKVIVEDFSWELSNKIFHQVDHMLLRSDLNFPLKANAIAESKILLLESNYD